MKAESEKSMSKSKRIFSKRKRKSSIHVRPLRKGDMVEWMELKVDFSLPNFPFPRPQRGTRKERHEGAIMKIPDNLKTGFFLIKDDSDGSLHIIDGSRCGLIRIKVAFD